MPEDVKDEEKKANGADNNEEVSEHKGKSKKMMLIGLVVLLLLGGGGAGYYFFVVKKKNDSSVKDESEPSKSESKKNDKKENKEEEKKPKEKHTEADDGPFYIGMDPFIVDLMPSDNKMDFVKIDLVLELASKADAEKIGIYMPKLRDICYGYLRSLKASDLRGAYGMELARANILKRINMQIEPLKVSSVLFTSIAVD